MVENYTGFHGWGEVAMNINCRALFKLFSQMALLGFGGVLPFAYRYLVERSRWLSDAEFGEVLGIAQLLPGPTICNMAVIVGQRFAGAAGACSALAGLLVAPFFIVIALGVAYQELATSALFTSALQGMAAAAAGLILATAAKLARGMWQEGVQPVAPGLPIAAAPAAAAVLGATTGDGPVSLRATQGGEDQRDASAAERETLMARRVAQTVMLVLAFVGLGVLKLGLVTVVCSLAPFGFVMFAFIWRLP